MELIYVWIENYKNIKNEEFNFNPNHKFELGEKEKDNYKLKDIFDKKDLKLPSGFFGKNSSNVTAIIGKNGSGKSSLLQAITKALAFGIFEDETFKNKQDSILLIFLDKATGEYSFFSKGTKFENCKIYLYGKVLLKSNLKDLNYIYYDEIFTKKPNKISEKNLKETDISLQSIFLKNEKDINLFSIDETKNIIIFLNKYRNRIILKEKTKITFPTYFFIKLKNDRDDNLENLNENLTKEIKKLMLRGLKKEFEINLNEHFELLYHAEIEDTILNIINSSKETQEIDFSSLQKLAIDVQNAFSQDFLDIIDIFIKKRGQKYLNFIMSFYKNIYLTLKNKNKNFLFKNERIEVKLNSSSNENVDKLIEFFSYDILDEQLLEYSFNLEMSSGEKSFLSIFSRLYWLKREFDFKKSRIILMDEPEIFMHPEWQRKFLDIFLKFTQELFTVQNTQIILSSHSPFVASDLPRNNVIMLGITEVPAKNENGKEEKDQDGELVTNKYCEVKKNKVKTFGANIFDLYKEGFFVDSTFGEFSKNKIKDIVKLLSPKNGEYNIIGIENNKEEIEYIIETIGEPLIANRIKNMYNTYKMKDLNSTDDINLLKNFEKMTSLEKLYFLKKSKYNIEKSDVK